ncbi:MAG: hypothetical protein ACFB5Z_11680 [Elainellaceae cyanobacterium]
MQLKLWKAIFKVARVIFQRSQAAFELWVFRDVAGGGDGAEYRADVDWQAENVARYAASGIL